MPSKHGIGDQRQQPTPSQPPNSQSIPLQSNAPSVMLQWFDAYKSCQRFFLNNAQHTPFVQAVCAHMNIRLPYEKPPPPWVNNNSQTVSLTPYIRRLVCTGCNTNRTLEAFFGSGWSSGLSNIHRQEERNYLFAAKSADWLSVKMAYDIGSEETAPFLFQLDQATEQKIMNAERDWSEWIAMQDWQVGVRRPASLDHEWTQSHSSVADSARGDSGLGDSGRGDSGRGDSGLGDSGRGDSGRGDSGLGDSGRGDSGRGDSGRGMA